MSTSEMALTRRHFWVWMLVVLPVLCAGCSHESEYYSLTSIHKNVRFTSGGAVVGVADFIDKSSAYNAGTSSEGVKLAPDVEAFGILVEFASTPAVRESLEYANVGPHGNDQSFVVFERGSGLLDLATRSATITGIAAVVSDAEIGPFIPPGDTIKDKRSFSYTINWNDSQLVGEIYMVKSSHFESDPLLN